MLGGKGLHDVSHGTFLFRFNPYLLEWVKEGFVELCHQSEAGSFIKEIKLFVVFIRLFIFNSIVLRVNIKVSLWQ